MITTALTCLQVFWYFEGAESADKVPNPASGLTTIDLTTTRYVDDTKYRIQREIKCSINVDAMIATQPHVADESRPTLPVPRCSSSLPGYPPGFHQTNINSMKLNIFFPACGAFHWGRFCEGLPKVRLVFLQTGRPTWTGPRLHQSLEGEPRPAAILANWNLYVVSLGEAFNA